MYLEVDWCRYSSFQRIFLATSDITIFFTQNLNLYLPSSLSTAAPPPQNQARSGKLPAPNISRAPTDCTCGEYRHGENSQKNWMEMCGPLLKTLALFMAKIFDFSYPIIEFITKMAKIDNLFMTKIVKNTLLGST